MSTNNRNGNSRSQAGARNAGRSRQNSRAAQNVRMSAAQRARRNTKKRRKPDYDYRWIAIIGVVLILVIAAAVYLTRRPGREKTPVEAEATTEQETGLQKDVTVDGISITGMSKSAAREKLLEHFSWGMQVTYEGADAPYEVPNLMEDKVNKLLEEVFGQNPKESYTLDTGGLEEAVSETVGNIAEKWDVKPVNGAIAGFDKDTGKFIYSGEKAGRMINREQLEADMNKALADKNFKAVLTAASTEVQPEITEAQAKEMYKVIGTMTTTTTSNKDRNTNIQLAADALDGLIIQPGEEFSFNATTGNRTLEKGYKPAGAYVNGVLVEEPGGGVCQVSSTLYNAVVFSGLSTTERHAHSYEPSYITPGEDAMVSYDGYAGPDMKFINNTKDAVAIRAKFADRKLTISIVGIQILEDGEKLYMTSRKVADLDPPAPVYEENQTLELGVEKVVKQATSGSRWETNLVREKNGTIISNELFHKSTYKGKAATIQRNTSGVVIPPATDPAETSAVENSTAANPGETTAAQNGPGETTKAQENQGPGVETPAPTQAPAAPPDQPQASFEAPVSGESPSPTSAPAPAPTSGQTEALPPSPGGSGVTETIGANPF